MIDFKKLVGFEWDRGNLDHIEKHRVDFMECESVFLNTPLIITEDKNHSKVEKRYRVYGKTNLGRRLNIVITIRRDKIRIVSARDQNKKECREYQEEGGVN